MAEKVLTFKIIGPGGSWIIAEEMVDVLHASFGCNKDRRIDEKVITDGLGEIEDGESLTYKIVIERKYTRAELDKMPDSDGDIH